MSNILSNKVHKGMREVISEVFFRVVNLNFLDKVEDNVLKVDLFINKATSSSQEASEPKESKVLLGIGEKVAKLGFLVVFIIGVFKGIIGFYTGSVSLLAQALDSLTDLFSLIAVFIGMRVSQRPPSERFPYGYYRFETLTSLLIALLIVLTGGEMLRRSIIRILNPKPLSTPLYALAVAAISIPILYQLYSYTIKTGNKINSQALINQATDFKTDIYSSFLVIVGVSSSLVGYPLVESLAGSVISLFVLKMGAILVWQALLVLSDAVVNPDQIIKIKKIAEDIRGVRIAQKIRIRRSGPFCMGELTIGVDKRLPVEQTHRLSETVERQIKAEIPEVESLVIHVEPQEERIQRLAIPIEEDKGLESLSTPHFGEAPYFLFIDIEDNTIVSWTTTKNPSLDLERKRGVTLAKLLIKEEITTLLTGEIGEGPFHYLRDSFIEIYKLNNITRASVAIKTFLDGRVKRFEKPKEEKKHLS